MEKIKNPCVGCSRVSDPEECMDKTCRDWQRWFLHRWEQIRQSMRQLKDQPNPLAGVPVGGNRYASPNQVRAYLRQDPCGSCQYPRELCKTPCRKRLVWEDCVREEA